MEGGADIGDVNAPSGGPGPNARGGGGEVYYGSEQTMQGAVTESDPTIIDAPAAPASAITLYYVTDHLGTVRAVVNDQGSLVERHDYTPFGVEIPPSTNVAENTHQYTGQERDETTGMDYMHFRYYGSNLGRFMKPDNVMGTAMNPQDWNLYSYVHGNPVNFNDPTGHAAELQQQQPKQATSASAQPAAKQPSVATQQTQAAAKLGGTIYNETGSLRPTVKKKNSQKAGSASDLHDARKAIGKVILNIKASGKNPNVASSSVSTAGKGTKQYADSVSAAKEAIKAGGNKAGPKHFYIRSGALTAKNGAVTGGDQPAWAKGVTPTASYGPFSNPVKVGDVAAGNSVYVDIYNVP